MERQEYTVLHHEAEHRFCIETGGYTGYVEYKIDNGALDILHTIVPKEIGGRGIASILVKAAYDHARQSGLKTAATCSYAVKWLEKHPEYKAEE